MKITTILFLFVLQSAGLLLSTRANVPSSSLIPFYGSTNVQSWLSLAATRPSKTVTGEWQFLRTQQWNKVKTGSSPGDGSMGIRVIQFDERGGEVEATIAMAQSICSGPTETEVIRFKWTFLVPILTLKPGDTVPLTVETSVSQSAQRCKGAAAYRSWVDVAHSGGSGTGFLIPEDQRKNFYAYFSQPPNILPTGMIWQFNPGNPDSSSGRSLIRISELTPSPTEPQQGEFAIHFETRAASGSGDDVGFFYFYNFRRGGCSGLTGKYGIRTANGNYLTAVRGGGIRGPGAIHTDATAISGWETFEFVPQSDGKYAIKTASGNFLTAMSGGGLTGADVIHTDATKVDAWEKFTIACQPDGTYAIQTINGNYLTALNGGGIGGGRPAIHTNATSVSGWEKFKLISIPSGDKAAYDKSTAPSVSAPRPTAVCTTLAGDWTQQSERAGQSTWHITEQGEATESGLGQARGTATLIGRKLRIDWKTPNGAYSGYYEWELDSNCKSGSGSLVFITGGSGSQKSTVRK